MPDVAPGARYKYEILAADSELTLKADPYAQEAELPPKTASVVTQSTHEWSAADTDWLRSRRDAEPLDRPMSIYEVHMGSWRLNTLEDNRSLNYIELADELSAYVTDMGFTHIELLPVMHHPFSGSWGYQVTGYFAPSPRYGSPDDFREFVDRLHSNGLGVILDWVPAHFPRDAFALARFDGTALYEHEDPRRGAHPDWGTLVFNFGRHEVRNFLISNALFWLREYHVERDPAVDAVAAMLYLDYSRREGEWIPNEFGGREDLDAVSFLKELNEVIYGREPGVVSAAEESTAWPGVSRPTYIGGLGFGFKWNMGWMHDTLGYFQQDPIYRRYHHHELTFSLLYAFSENFILPLSHDEVVHGKGSLYTKMAGDRWQKLANLRALYGYMWAHPGKKLLFMGQEFAQQSEWRHERSLDWPLLERPDNVNGVQSLCARPSTASTATNRRCGSKRLRQLRAFWGLEPNDSDRNVIAFARASKDFERVLVFVTNLSPVPRHWLPARLAACAGRWREAMNTDSSFYGGSGRRQPRGCRNRSDPVARTASLRGGDAATAGGALRWSRQSDRYMSLKPLFHGSGRLPAQRPLGDGTVEFRVWASRARKVVIALRLGRRGCSRWMMPGYGVYETVVDAADGDEYCYVVDGRRLPDPCSRSQPKGLRGAAPVLDVTPAERSAMPGSAELVIYELHVGTFTPEGTFEAAAEHLAELAEIGITAIELMPVAEFLGHHGWGYDGVLHLEHCHFAYGGPGGLAALVAAAHEHGLEVILDVVYNHVGASGVKALDRFGPYFTSLQVRETPWGEAINFDGPDSDPVREWVLQSAESWIRDYNIDGLRLDAIHSIYDSNAEHIVAAIVRRVHAVRDDAWVIAESGLNDPRVVRVPELGGYGCNAAWADDFHHALRTVLTGEREGYYAEFGRLAASSPRRFTVRTSTTATTRSSDTDASVPAPTTCRRAGSSSSPRTTIRSATAPTATECPRRQGRLRRSARCCRRLCRCCSWARNTASRRRFSSSPTTSTSGSRTPRARAGGASSPRLRSSARRFLTRRTSRRSSVRN